MIRAAAFLAMAAAGAGVSVLDWMEVSYTAGGSVWSLARGTVSLQTVDGRPHVTAAGRIVTDGAEVHYTMAVPEAHCGQPRGDVLLLLPDGRVAHSAVFAASQATAGRSIATALCKQHQARRR